MPLVIHYMAMQYVLISYVFVQAAFTALEQQ